MSLTGVSRLPILPCLSAFTHGFSAGKATQGSGVEVGGDLSIEGVAQLIL